MPKLAKALTALEIRRIDTPGLHAVGEVAGLCLYIKPGTGTKSWVLRTMVGGKRCAIGLGGNPTVTLAQARDRARAVLDQIVAGQNPINSRRADRKKVNWTFKKTAEAYIAAHRAGWKNAKHAAQWESTLKTYAYPHFGEKHVAEVGRGDVLAAVEPIWLTKHETATRVLNRIELVLSYALQREYRPEGLNPARWKDNLDKTLPSRPKAATAEAHFTALPYAQMYAFMKRLRAGEGMGARALEFTILTAARSGEVRGAVWDEIDMVNGLWTIPAARMKAGREHRIPLSEAALELLEKLPRFEGVDLVFPGAKGDKPLSDMSITAVLRRMKIDATVHGFRSTFRDWTAERTSTPNEVAEMALAHAIADKTESAYRRGDLFDKRRELMDLWAKHLVTPPPTGNVRAIRRAG